MGGVEIAQIVLSIVQAVGTFLLEAFRKGDASALDRPLKDILPHELRSEAAKHLADAAAVAKFGSPPNA